MIEKTNAEWWGADPEGKRPKQGVLSEDCPTTPCSAIPVVVDPEYSRFIVQSRLIAKQDGYAIAIHGSLTRDLDLIAVPWSDNCRAPINLVSRIEAYTGWQIQPKDKDDPKGPTVREHGRLVWSFLAPTQPDCRFVDFSVIPPNRGLSSPKTP